MLHIPPTILLLLAAKQEPYKNAYLLTKNIEELYGESSEEWTSRQKKTERVTGLGRRTRAEIAKWNQMTALSSGHGGEDINYTNIWKENQPQLTFPFEQFALTAGGVGQGGQTNGCSNDRIHVETGGKVKSAQWVSRGEGHFLRDAAEKQLQLLFARVFVIKAATGVTKECNLQEGGKKVVADTRT